MHNTLTCGLQFMTSAKPTQLARWHCKHCGATNHYSDNCPFRPNHSPTITGGQRAVTRGNLTPDHTWHSIQISHQKPIACRDFNHNTCCRPDCKFAHCYEHCQANHAVQDCAKYGWHPLNCNHGLQYDRSYSNRNWCDHPDKAFVRQLIHDLQHGCMIGYNGPQFANLAKNLLSAYQQPEVINTALKKIVKQDES